MTTRMLELVDTARPPDDLAGIHVPIGPGCRVGAEIAGVDRVEVSPV